VRGPGARVDAEAAASHFAFFEGYRLWSLRWQGHRPRRDAFLGPVWMPERWLRISPSSKGVVFGHLGGKAVGPVGTRSWDRCVCCRGSEARAAAPKSVV
jgi:hypothetical protein